MIYKTSEYIDADLCENCGSKVIRRIYRDDEGHEIWETVCRCGIHTD